MNLILYYLLRRFTVRLEYNLCYIRLIRGVIIKREYYAPINSLTMIEQRQTVIMRLLGAKKITLRTLSGRGFSFWLHKSEGLIDVRGAAIRPKRRAVLLGALVDTRALSGVVVFILTLRRIYTVLGSGYYDKALSALALAADELQKLLETAKISVPRIITALAIFVAAAWLWRFSWKLLAMCRFRVIAMREYFVIRRGIITLYECAVVRRNINAAVSQDNLTTLLFGAAPLYVNNTMIFPPVCREARSRAEKILCRIPCGQKYRAVKPPLRAIFGHCAQPLGWLATCAVLYGAAWLGRYFEIIPPVPLIRSVLVIGAFVSAWYAVVYAIYMFRSELICTKNYAKITARRGARLYTAVMPSQMRTESVLGRNLFQIMSGMCDAELRVLGGKRFKLRNIPYEKASKSILNG